MVALRPARRWLRFSLRTLLVLVALMGVFLAWVGNEVEKIRDRKAALAEIEAVSIAIRRDSPRMLGFWSYWTGDEDVVYLMLKEEYALRIGLARTDELQARFGRLFPEAGIRVMPSGTSGDMVKMQYFFPGAPSIPYGEWRAQHSDASRRTQLLGSP